MAVTCLWPMKCDVGKLIDYVRNPEKTTEPEETHAEGETGEEKRMYVTGINCSEEYAKEQFEETKRIWSRIRAKDKTGGRTCYHGYQSFEEGSVTAELAHEIGVKLAQKLWGEKYELLVATHCNTDHYHNHIISGNRAICFANKSYTRYRISLLLPFT